jgi:ABC-2 type transport system permease protein
MIQHILAIGLKELKILMRDLEALGLLFAMPVFFILVMTFALEGVFEAGKKGSPIQVLVVDRDRSKLTEDAISDMGSLEGILVVREMDGIPLSLAKAEELIRNRTFPMALLFPKGFSEGALSSLRKGGEKGPVVTFLTDPATNRLIIKPIQGALRGMIERRVFSFQLPARLQEAFGHPIPLGASAGLHSEDGNKDSSADTPIGGTLLKLNGPAVKFVSAYPSGFRATRRPDVKEQNVPAYTIFGVFFIVLTLATSFYQEKQVGTFQRILVSPVSRAALLVGKLIPYYLVNLIQIALMFSLGVVIFGMRLGNMAALIVVSLALAAASNGLGLVVAALGKTEAQINGLSVLLAITLGALGGMMVPSFVMPGFMRHLSLITPHAWALEAYHDVIVRGLGVAAVLPETGMLMGFSAFFFLIALLRFRFH